MRKLAKTLATFLVMGIPVWVVLFGVLREEAGSLVVRLAEPNVTVWVEGRQYPADTLQIGPIEVAPGDHLVRVTRDGKDVYSERVTVEPGGRKQVAALWPTKARAAGAGQPTAQDLGGERSRLGHAQRVNAVGFADGGRLGLAADADGALRVWNLAQARPERVIAAHSATVDAMAVFDDGRGMLSVSHDNVIRVWDVASGREVRAIPVRSATRIAALAVTRDGRTVAAGDEHANVRLLDVTTGRTLSHWQTPNTSVGALAFSPDGRTVVVGLIGEGDGPHPVEVREAATGRLVHQLTGHAGPVWGVACLPDGLRAVSVGGDRALRVWDLKNGRELARLGDHPGAARCLAVSPDGRFAAVGTGHRWAGGWRPADAYGVQVWDLNTGRCLGRFTTDAAVCSVALSPDGRHALAAGEDRVVRSWDMPAPEELAGDPPLSAQTKPTAPPAPAPTNPAGST